VKGALTKHERFRRQLPLRRRCRIAAPIMPEPGAKVVMYLEGFGRLSGRVVRACGEAEFAVIFESSPHKREKLAETLTWRMNQDRLGLTEDAPSGPALHQTRIETDDGAIIDGQVLDFSLAGVTIRSLKPPPLIGSWVRIGNVHGRVARYTEGGFAVDFEPRTSAQRDELP
jgi:hypothetical protein